MTKNRTPTPVYLDPGMHPGLEVKGLSVLTLLQAVSYTLDPENAEIILYKPCTPKGFSNLNHHK